MPVSRQSVFPIVLASALILAGCVEVLDPEGGAGDETSNKPPAAAFDTSPADPDTATSVHFTDESTDADGTIVNWSWDLGDGNTSTDANPTHAYGDDGTYTVSLTITDDGGATNTTMTTLEVQNAAPTADFTIDRDHTTPAAAVTLTDASTDSDGTIVAWAWDFGDGTASTDQQAVHAYPVPGVYTVTLTVTDDDGTTNTTASTVTVQLPAMSVSFLTNWLPERHHYILKTNVTDLPEGFSIVVTVNDGAETLEVGDLTARSSGVWNIPATTLLEPGDEVTLEAKVGDIVLESRQILVDDGEAATPGDLTVHATYGGTLDVIDTDPASKSTFHLDVDLLVDATPAREIIEGTATGSASFREDGFEMTTDTLDLTSREVDGAIESEVMTMEGAWAYDDGAGGTGAGTAFTVNTFVGYDTRFIAGHLRAVKLVDTQFNMTGTFFFDGAAASFTSSNATLEVYDNETEELIWISGTETSSITFDGAPTEEETITFDGPPEDDEEDDGLDLMDAADWTGITPHPLVAGDKFQLTGLEGLLLSVVVMEADPLTYAGETFETLQAEGTITGGGASGTETWRTVRGGSFDGLPLEEDVDVTRGTERYTAAIRLKTLA